MLIKLSFVVPSMTDDPMVHHGGNHNIKSNPALPHVLNYVCTSTLVTPDIFYIPSVYWSVAIAMIV